MQLPACINTKPRKLLAPPARKKAFIRASFSLSRIRCRQPKDCDPANLRTPDSKLLAGKIDTIAQ
jgi:hypothetical protein